MIPEMDALLTTYEQGLLSRRALLQALAATAGSLGQRPSEGVLRGRNLNHVNLQVADVDRSATFYRTLFSLPPTRPIPNRPPVVDLADGSFISLQASDRPGRIDHFDVGVDEFNPERVTAALRQAQLDRGLITGPDFVIVDDPDGIRVQISTVDWTG